MGVYYRGSLGHRVGVLVRAGEGESTFLGRIQQRARTARARREESAKGGSREDTCPRLPFFPQRNYLSLLCSATVSRPPLSLHSRPAPQAAAAAPRGFVGPHETVRHPGASTRCSNGARLGEGCRFRRPSTMLLWFSIPNSCLQWQPCSLLAGGPHSTRFVMIELFCVLTAMQCVPPMGALTAHTPVRDRTIVCTMQSSGSSPALKMPFNAHRRFP